MPTTEMELGLDGTEYIVEGRDRDTYHVVDRWEADGPFRRLCDLFVDLTPVDNP